MPNALYGSASCAVGTDIYIFGGNGAHQDSLFKYDTLANEWSTLASMVSCEIYTSATVIGDVVYIVGAGYYGREVLRFDLPSGVCSTCAPTSSHQVSGASFKLNGCLHAISGESGQGMTVQRYITASDTWTEVAKLQAERSSYCAVTVGIALPAVADQNLFDSLIVKALHSCT
jgi:N-acetylneuraminic acid mutarotase